MLKRIGLPLIAMFALLILVNPPQAKAGVHIGVQIGPAYPAYDYGYPYAYSYPYADPGYYAPYPYAAPGYVYRFRDYDRYRDYRERERYHREREFRRDWRDRNWRR